MSDVVVRRNALRPCRRCGEPVLVSVPVQAVTRCIRCLPIEPRRVPATVTESDTTPDPRLKE